LKNFSAFFLLSIFALALSIFPTFAQDEEEPKSKPEIRILVVGNEYIMQNDFAGTFRQIVNNAPDAVALIDVRSEAIYGANLEKHWKKAQIQNMLASRTLSWDFVILQNESNWPFEKMPYNNAFFYGRKFAELILAADAVPIVMATWPKAPGSKHYETKPWMRNFLYSFDTINARSKVLAADLGGFVAPVNTYWSYAVTEMPDIALYRDDASSPTPVGTYLMALVTYKALTGHALAEPHWLPARVNKETAQKLHDLVALPLSQ